MVYSFVGTRVKDHESRSRVVGTTLKVNILLAFSLIEVRKLEVSISRAMTWRNKGIYFTDKVFEIESRSCKF